MGWKNASIEAYGKVAAYAAGTAYRATPQAIAEMLSLRFGQIHEVGIDGARDARRSGNFQLVGYLFCTDEIAPQHLIADGAARIRTGVRDQFARHNDHVGRSHQKMVFVTERMNRPSGHGSLLRALQ